jgi:hypothetical protein
VNLSTNYLGMVLKNPIVASSDYAALIEEAEADMKMLQSYRPLN